MNAEKTSTKRDQDQTLSSAKIGASGRRLKHHPYARIDKRIDVCGSLRLGFSQDVGHGNQWY